MTWREHLAAVIGAVLVLSVIAVVVARPIAVNLGGAEFTSGLAADPIPRELPTGLRIHSQSKDAQPVGQKTLDQQPVGALAAAGALLL